MFPEADAILRALKAKDATSGLGGPARAESIPVLIEVVRNDPKSDAGGAAVRALGSMGPDAKAAIPALKYAEGEYQNDAERFKQIGKGTLPSQLAFQISSVQEALKKIGQ